MLFSEYFKEWYLREKKGVIRPVTLVKYEVTQRRIAYLAPNLKVKDLKREEYRDLLNRYAETHEKSTIRDFHRQRKSNQQDFTPESITQLMATLTDVTVSQSYGWTAYDCAAGTGAMILSKWKKERNKHLPWDYRPHNYLYLCEELSDITIPYLIHNLAPRGMNAVVIHGDTLEQTANQAYFIQNANDNPLGFSSVNVLPHSKAVQEFLSIKEWTADPIDHIEDELSDVVWRPLPNEQPIPFSLKEEINNES